MNQGLIKGFDAGAAITGNRIVKFSSTDTTIVQAAAATDSILGVADSLGAASGARVDVVLSGTTEVEYGGTITRGDLLTADSNGKAVTAAPSAGVNNRIVGISMKSGVSGDIGLVLVNPFSLQGA
ncbi:MAG: DUF2190 family protein [Ignavibacteriales bacterium]|nr:DUF2190 family protein [Ignavibacteriales bacterium]